MSHYDHRTGELRGETVCHYCGTLRRIVPLGQTSERWHDSAECVNMLVLRPVIDSVTNIPLYRLSICRGGCKLTLMTNTFNFAATMARIDQLTAEAEAERDPHKARKALALLRAVQRKLA